MVTARVGTEARGRIRCMKKDGEGSNCFQNWVIKHGRALVITALRRQRLEDSKFEVHLSYTVELLENQNPKQMTEEPEQGTSHDPKLESQY